MAHRHADYVDYCFECEEKAVGDCFRCGLKLCKTHHPEPEKRCSRCESKYAHDLQIQLYRVNRPTFEATQLLGWTWSFFKISAISSLLTLGVSVFIPLFLSLFFLTGIFLFISGVLLGAGLFYFAWDEQIEKKLIAPNRLKNEEHRFRTKFLEEKTTAKHT